jgi:hypothetical protein
MIVSAMGVEAWRDPQKTSSAAARVARRLFAGEIVTTDEVYRMHVSGSVLNGVVASMRAAGYRVVQVRRGAYWLALPDRQPAWTTEPYPGPSSDGPPP